MMNKFQVKSFECDLLAELFQTLEDRKLWYSSPDEKGEITANNENDAQRIKIVEGLQAKLEKLL